MRNPPAGRFCWSSNGVPPRGSGRQYRWSRAEDATASTEPSDARSGGAFLHGKSATTTPRPSQICTCRTRLPQKMETTKRTTTARDQANPILSVAPSFYDARMKIDQMRRAARSPVAAPPRVRGFLLTATAVGLLAVIGGCEAPAEKSAWERAGAETSKAVEDAKRAAAEKAEDGWEAIKESTEKAWDTTKKTSVAAVDEVKKAAGVSEE
jgi:hypothetical protein